MSRTHSSDSPRFLYEVFYSSVLAGKPKLKNSATFYLLSGCLASTSAHFTNFDLKFAITLKSVIFYRLGLTWLIWRRENQIQQPFDDFAVERLTESFGLIQD